MIPIQELPTAIDAAEKAGWTRIGAGCSRSAYVHEDRPGVVLKIDVRDGTHNERECLLWEENAESFFGFVLTPILARTSDYRSILMKRMTIVKFGAPGSDWGVFDMARQRPLMDYWVQHWKGQHEKDMHQENWGCQMDDYGFLVPGRVVDYAGV